MSRNPNPAPEGMHIAKEAQELTERMAPGVITAPVDANTQGIQGGAVASQFPKKFDARDRMDDEMNMKMQLMDDKGMTPFGQVYYDDKVGKWLERKSAVAESANFDAWFGKNFHKNDLASRQWAQQVNPNFYSEREKEMADRAQMVLKIKGIQMRGPQSKEDLYIQYMIDSGRVKLPADWDRLGINLNTPGDRAYDEIAAQQKERYAFGLIRMPLFLSSTQRQTRAVTNKALGAWGDSTTARAYPFGEDATATQRPLLGPPSSQGYRETNFLKTANSGL